MQNYKKEFIEFMVRAGVVTFGDFIARSGRKTPYFVNTGNYSTGEHLATLGRFYAKAIQDTFPDSVDVLFGPAYKGIPLVTAAAMTLSSMYGRNVAFCFNRKEAKNHGEGGTLIGHKLRDNDRVVIVEDVTTAGTSIRESIPLLRTAADVRITGLIVSVDRMERGQTNAGALAELRSEFNLCTSAIVTIEEIIEHLHNHPIDGKVVLNDDIYDKIVEYRHIYSAQ